MTNLHQLTITQASALIADRSLSPVALMEALLARADALEPALRVWVTLDPEAALEDARRSERELESGKSRGPLHGIPIAIKDIYNTKGVLTTSCSPIYAGYVPDHDAHSVALLRSAGAVIMGKAVTTQFASGDPSPTRNAWNTAHTPGGSSSGSAAGVAARIFPVAMGSQTGGSILRPASYNGVVGLKPTYGRVSKHGVFPLAWSLDTLGPIARSVEDTAIVLDALAGHDPKDPASSTRPVGSYRRAAVQHARPPRVGYVSQFFDDNSDDETRAHTHAALERLAEAGADVVDFATSADFEELRTAHSIIMAVEAAGIHEADFSVRPDDFGPRIRASIERGHLTPAVAYVRAQRTREKIPPRHPARHDRRRRAAHALHARARPPRPHHHRRHGLPEPLDHLRLPRHHPPLRPRRQRPPLWRPASRRPLRRRAPPLRRRPGASAPSPSPPPQACDTIPSPSTGEGPALRPVLSLPNGLAKGQDGGDSAPRRLGPFPLAGGRLGWG